MKPNYSQLRKAMLDSMNNSKSINTSKKADKWFNESFLPGGINHHYHDEILNDKELLKLSKKKKK